MNVLHVEDSLLDLEIAHTALVKKWPDCAITQVDTLPAVRGALLRREYDLILADFHVPGFDGHAVLKLVRELNLSTPVIFLSGMIGEETAFDLIREGAADYVFKNRLERLYVVIPRVLKEGEERRRRQKAEEELRVSEDRFRSIFLTMIEGVMLLDGEDRIISVNPSAQRILGFEATDMIGSRPKWRAIHEDLRPFAPDEFPWDVVRQTHGPSRDLVMGLYQPQGTLVWVTAHAQPLHQNSAEGNAQVVVTLHDITPVKSLEERFIRAQRLESVGMLAAGVAHDLNNVLAPVLMGVPLLRENTRNPSDEKLLSTLEKCAMRGADLVRQILSFTKGIHDGNIVVQPRHLITELVTFLEATLPKSIQIERDVDSVLWPILANPTQLHQVLLNLCVNARDAMPAGGVLKLTAINVRLDFRAVMNLGGIPPGPYIRIEIADTGTGIAPELLSRIWEPFFTTKAPNRGTGLGLSTVRGIVQNHHGFIDVRSEVGRGSTFRLLFPADEKSIAAELPPSTVSTSARGQGECILVADDEVAIRDVVAATLTEQGYRPIMAADGLQAYSHLLQQGERIAILISDLDMPELDGAALAMMTRRQYPETKIIMMTGQGSLPSREGNFQDRSDAFLPKPFTREALLRAVCELLQGEKVE